MTITAHPSTADTTPDTGTAAISGAPVITGEFTADVTESPAATVPFGVVIECAPAEVLADVNVRDDLALDPDFIASVKENGVLNPAIAVRTAEGRIRIRFGHRRRAAAIETGRTLPVIVVADEATDTAAQIDRLISQYVENEHRTGLSTAEKVGVAEQLELLGVSATRIARRTRMPRKQVAAALTVAKSTVAKNAAEHHNDLDLNQLAALAEFETEEAVVSALLAAARTGDFSHTLQRARDGRTDAAEHAAAVAWLTERGVPVISDETFASPAVRFLNELTDNLDTREAITVAAHAACDGHAVLLKRQWRTWTPTTTDTHTHTDTDVDSQAADSSAEDPAAQPWAARWRLEYVCTDHAQHGHQLRHVYTTSTSAPKVKAADLPPQERAANTQARRELIAKNKAWESAETVRRDALTNLARRARAPKGTIAFLAATMAHDSGILNDIKANHLAADLLDSKTGGGGYGRSNAIQQMLTKANEARAHVIHLIMVLAAYEARADRKHWQHHDTTTARYLTFLASTGYKLSDVEQLAATRPTEPTTTQPQDNTTTGQPDTATVDPSDPSQTDADTSEASDTPAEASGAAGQSPTTPQATREADGHAESAQDVTEAGAKAATEDGGEGTVAQPDQQPGQTGHTADAPNRKRRSQTTTATRTQRTRATAA